MADLTRFDFHAKRFYFSEKVKVMSAEEVGQYLLLLVAAWLGGKDASLPDNPTLLAREARVLVVSEVVLAMFPVIETEHGPRRRNETLYEEWLVATERSEVGRTHGRVGGLSTSPAKQEAARNNGRLGGRPAVLRVNDGLSETEAEPNENLSETETQTNPNQTNPNQTNPNQSNPNQTDSNQSGASAAVLSSSKKQQGDWKSIAIRHKNVFGKQASVKFKDKFFKACAQYGEDVVLECFDAWAEGAKTWVTSDQPLFLFFKNLNSEAENIIEINEAVQEEKTLAVQQKQREEQMQAASTERQCKENADRFAVKERVGVESVDDFLKG